jgi:hypothetical protein
MLVMLVQLLWMVLQWLQELWYEVLLRVVAVLPALVHLSH